MLRQIVCCCTVAATVFSLNGCGATITPNRPPPPPAPTTPVPPKPTPRPTPAPSPPAPTPDSLKPTPGAPTPRPMPAPSPPAPTPDAPKPTPKPTPAPPTSSASTTTTTTTTTTRGGGGGACTSPFWNDTHSCFAGIIVDAKKEIICGANSLDGKPAIYPRATTSCGGQFNPFNPKEMFFCYTSNYSYSVGKCAPWKDDFDTSCTCSQPRVNELAPVSSAQDEPMVNGWAPTVDTRKRPSAEEESTGPCWTPTADYGCMNGHRYNYGTQQPCGNWLADPRTHGCCPTTGEFSPYNVKTESCCNGDDGQYQVKAGGHACQCTTCGSIVTV